MQENTHNGHRIELLAYILFAAFFASAISYLCYNGPVIYAFLITEDSIAEYLTSASFGLAGVILLALSFRRGPKVRKFMWAFIGVVALVIAAEEISWGQRILSVKTPEALIGHNMQREITLHNLVAFDSVNRKLHMAASYLILMYVAFSLMVLTLLPRVEEKFIYFGVPLIQIRLIPVFLLAPYFLILDPVLKADEFGELSLGIAAFMWAVDLYMTSAEKKRSNQLTSILIMAGMLSFAVIISAGLAYRYPYDAALTMRINLMASRDYHDDQLYEQSEILYNYIYEHPQHLMPETRLNHTKMLLAADRKFEATKLVSEAIREVEAGKPQGISSSRDFVLYSNQLRSFGEINLLLVEKPLADDYFDQAVIAGQKALSLGQTPDKKAKALWSISLTMAARGDIAGAIVKAEQAIEAATSIAFRHKIGRQLKIWKK